MSKLKGYNKIPIDLNNKVTLIRLGDNLRKSSSDIKFIEWNEGGNFKELHDKMKIGRSAILAPFNAFFIWQTTPIIEIISDTEFKTKNSHYKIEYESKF